MRDETDKRVLMKDCENKEKDTRNVVEKIQEILDHPRTSGNFQRTKSRTTLVILVLKRASNCDPSKNERSLHVATK